MTRVPGGIILRVAFAVLCSRDACSVAARRGGFRAHDRRSARCVFLERVVYVPVCMTDPKVNQLEVLDPSYNLVKTYTGLNTPVGDYVDPKGNLYVANEGTCAGTGNVVEYAHGSASPTYTYSAGLNLPLLRRRGRQRPRLRLRLRRRRCATSSSTSRNRTPYSQRGTPATPAPMRSAIRPTSLSTLRVTSSRHCTAPSTGP